MLGFNIKGYCSCCKADPHHKVSRLIIKITIFLIVIGLKNYYFSTNSLAKLLLSDTLLLDTLLDSLLSDS